MAILHGLPFTHAHIEVAGLELHAHEIGLALLGLFLAAIILFSISRMRRQSGS